MSPVSLVIAHKMFPLYISEIPNFILLGATVESMDPYENLMTQ